MKTVKIFNKLNLYMVTKLPFENKNMTTNKGYYIKYNLYNHLILDETVKFLF